MSWLKKFGSEVLHGFEVVVGVLDHLAPFINTGASIAMAALPADSPIIAGVADVFTMGLKYANWISSNIQDYVGAAGVDAKIQAVSAFVQQGIQKWFAANFPGTPKVSNQTLFTSSVQTFSQGLVDIHDSINTAKLHKASPSAIGADVVTEIMKYVQWAEFTGGVLLPGSQAGAQKSASISSEVQSIISEWLSLNLAGTSDITNQPLFEKGAGEVQQACVGFLNSLKPDVQTVTTVKS